METAQPKVVSHVTVGATRPESNMCARCQRTVVLLEFRSQFEKSAASPTLKDESLTCA